MLHPRHPPGRATTAKKERNYKCHVIIDKYIDDIVNKKRRNQDDIIDYLEDNHSCQIAVNNDVKDNLNKLISLNIKLKKKKNSP